MKKPQYHILLCNSFRIAGDAQGACNKKGASSLLQYISEEASDRGLDVAVSTTACLNVCTHWLTCGNCASSTRTPEPWMRANAVLRKYRANRGMHRSTRRNTPYDAAIATSRPRPAAKKPRIVAPWVPFSMNCRASMFGPKTAMSGNCVVIFHSLLLPAYTDGVARRSRHWQPD